MSVITPPSFVENLRLIQTLRSLPSTGCTGACGYTSSEIQTQHNALFPGTPLTLDQTFALLSNGSRRGVYLKTGCSSGATPPTDCNTFVPTALHGLENQTFIINTAMAAVNPHNSAYVAVGFIQSNSVPRIGFLPCSDVYCSAGGGPGYSPYSRASTSLSIGIGSGSVAGALSNNGIPTVGALPASIECGTCTN